MSDETKNKPALEDNFAELEDILKQMEQPEVSLEQSFLLYQSGVEKLKECNVMLDTVEKKMQILNAKGELKIFKYRRCIWRSRYGYQSGNRQTYG